MARPTLLELSRSALVNNLHRVRAMAPGQDCFAAVKADAYGHGLIEVARILESESVGLAVACFEEAMLLRQQGIQAAIVVMDGPLSVDELAVASQHQLQWVLHSEQQLAWVLAQHQSQTIWVKVNTGMNRLGLQPDRVLPVLKALRNHASTQVTHLMTHFACSDTPSAATHRIQGERWHRVIADLGAHCPSRLSMANSAALWSTAYALSGSIRPGIALYGCSPFAEKTGHDLNLSPVMSLKAGVISVQDIAAGETVGYGAEFVAPKAMKIAILAAGYGDGYPRHAPSGTPVWLQGERCPLVGRVSMDMLAIDISHLVRVNEGDMAELWGAQLPVEEVANFAGTIGYELYCAMSGRRAPRRWVA